MTILAGVLASRGQKREDAQMPFDVVKSTLREELGDE